MANIEANMAYSKHLSDLDDLGRAVEILITEARFGIRAGKDNALDVADQAHSTLEEFRRLAVRLDNARRGARNIARATGSRGAIFVDDDPRESDTVTAVWGEV
ncbi:MAG: hypothetical protein M3540_07070 [Actinomycetota bacterium]|nr:hypothetical protein [Actinomycetota bacterium]